MRWVFVAGLGVALVACGSEVEVFEDEELGAEEGLSGGEGDPGDPGSSCVRCGEGDCGLCFAMYGASHRCTDDHPPATGCFQLGSLFDDGDEHYVCYSCD